MCGEGGGGGDEKGAGGVFLAALPSPSILAKELEAKIQEGRTASVARLGRTGLSAPRRSEALLLHWARDRAKLGR